MPTKEEIEKLAYRLWEEEGRPQGRDRAHYYEAERLLRERENAAARAEAGASSRPPHRLLVRPTITRRRAAPAGDR